MVLKGVDHDCEYWITDGTKEVHFLYDGKKIYRYFVGIEEGVDMTIWKHFPKGKQLIAAVKAAVI